MRYRIEKDTLGELRIPAEVYYGIGSLRSKETYQITKHSISRQMIKALANIKKAAAKTNFEMAKISKEVSNAIMLSADEILNGRMHGQFITDTLQGGSGAAMDKNANEVIANRANELLGGKKGEYNLVSLDSVGLNQDSKDVALIAGKLSTIRLTKKLLTEAKKLTNAFGDKISDLGLQKDKELGEVLDSFSINIDRNIKRVNAALPSLLDICFKNDLEEDEAHTFKKKFLKHLVSFSGESLIVSKNEVDTCRNLDGLAYVSSVLKLFASDLSKSATDLILLDKKGLITIPSVDASDKYVVLEMVKQVSFYVMGNDLTISRAIEAGSLDENFYLPIILACMFEMSNMIRRTMRVLREQVISLL